MRNKKRKGLNFLLTGEKLGSYQWREMKHIELSGAREIRQCDYTREISTTMRIWREN